MSELQQTIREQCRAFARLHVRELAKELIQWNRKGVISGLRLQELADLWAPLDRDDSAMQQAKWFVEQAALDFAAADDESAQTSRT